MWLLINHYKCEFILCEIKVFIYINNLIIKHIKHVLNMNNQDLEDFGLPEPDMSVGDWRIERTVTNKLIPRLRELTQEEHSQLADQQQLMLNEEQAVNKFYSKLNLSNI